MIKTGFLVALLSTAAIAALAAPIKVPPTNAALLKKEVTQRKGRVVVINFWATWCPPCRAEFPDMVASHKKLATQGVDLLTVAVDESSDLKKVQAFLEQNGVTQGAFINKNGGEPDLGYFQWLDGKIPSSISIPRTYVLDRKGKVVARLIGGQSAQKFEEAIKQALAAK